MIDFTTNQSRREVVIISNKPLRESEGHTRISGRSGQNRSTATPHPADQSPRRFRRRRRWSSKSIRLEYARSDAYSIRIRSHRLISIRSGGDR